MPFGAWFDKLDPKIKTVVAALTGLFMLTGAVLLSGIKAIITEIIKVAAEAAVAKLGIDKLIKSMSVGKIA